VAPGVLNILSLLVIDDGEFCAEMKTPTPVRSPGSAETKIGLDLSPPASRCVHEFLM